MNDIPPKGYIDRLVAIVKDMTFTNVATFAALLMMLTTVALLWKLVNDEKMLSTVLSNYEVLPEGVGDCGMRTASPRGGKPSWFISNTFATNGQDRYYIGVNTTVEPSQTKSEAYCKSISDMIDYIMDPVHKPEPMFPNSNRIMFPPANSVPTVRDIPTERMNPTTP